MFENRKSQVRVNEKMSKKFPVGRGVAQGCPMSPLFFNIYVNDLIEKIRAEGLGVKVGYAVLAALAFADDLVLCGNFETMQKYIKILEDWCLANGFKINVDKCAIMRLGMSKK